MTISLHLVTYAAGVVALISLIVAISASQTATQQRKRLARLMKGSRENLEAALVDAQSAAGTAAESVRDMEERLTRLESEFQHALTRVGMVRFNPFSDTGSDLSFAVALLNNRLDGVVLTGLWGREEVRVYAKQVTEGQSHYVLSDEERQALELARRQKLTRERPASP